MKYPGLCSGTYANHLLVPAGDRCKNLYPETQGGAGNPESQKVLVHTPGYAAFGNFFAAGPIQGIFLEPSTRTILVISGSVLWVGDVSGVTWNSKGVVGSGPYQFASNGVQVMISAAASQTGFIYTIATNTLVQITAPGFMGTVGCVMLDNYFISVVPTSRKFQISAILDGTQWDALDWTQVEGGSENIVSLHVDHGELWVLCEEHTEIFQDTGNAAFPFERIKSISIEQGIASPYAVCSTDNSVFWLARNKDGWCRVFRSDGYVPKGVSNRSIEYFFNMYASSFSPGALRWDVTMYSYQNETGHTFIVINFPSATAELGPDGKQVLSSILGAQWVYDVGENEWHERMKIDPGSGKEAMARGIYHAFIGGGKHIVGGGAEALSQLYTMDENVYLDNGQTILRYRRAPHIVNGIKWVVYHYLRLLAKVGFCTTAGAADDVINLRVSNDGGMTWTGYYPKSLGHTGEFTKEICWRALGRSKRRVFEFSTSVIAPICIEDADLGVDGEA